MTTFLAVLAILLVFAAVVLAVAQGPTSLGVVAWFAITGLLVIGAAIALVQDNNATSSTFGTCGLVALIFASSTLASLRRRAERGEQSPTA